MVNYKITPLVQGLPATVPFIGPETQERLMESAFAVRIGANENVFGPSPRVVEAMSKTATDVWMYGDPEIHDLRCAVAQHHNLHPENILIGEGIDGLLSYVVRMLVEPGDTVVTSDGAYPTFNYHVIGYGGKLKFVPYYNDHEDPEYLLKCAVDYQPKLLYLANPDNPMGTWWEADVIDAMISRVPEGTLMLLDEAYSEFAPKSSLPEIDVSDSRVLRFRTFSKAYGLAGLRVGYAIGHRDLISEFNKVRNHFGVGRISQVAALAALEDSHYLREVVTNVKLGRQRLMNIARSNNLIPLNSAANFVAIDCGRDGNYAKSILQELVKKGIFVRMPNVPPLDRCIRISVGRKTDLDRLEVELRDILAVLK
ncbi:MAG: histidinol-phosphate aminotransferase [Acidiferrobacteraceae bacterium]|nr:histidinol-phosphate aminotransferase [Acidiferrobacteraceae bacterium]|tara:strand:- start:2301 stop:3404 length:1104 start_codon:yes stop_codon:yes gene_type:complete